MRFNLKWLASLRGRQQIAPLMLSESKRINLHFPRNHQKTYDFTMISGRIEVNSLIFA